MGNTKDPSRWGRGPSGATPSAKRSVCLHAVRGSRTTDEDPILYPTDAVTPSAKFRRKDSTWLQNLLDTADNADWIPFAPMQDCVAENLIELAVLGHKLGCKLIAQRLNILNMDVFQSVFLSLVDLRLLMRTTSYVQLKGLLRLPCSDWNLCLRQSRHS